MKITRFEQSGFIFETNSGFRLALDIATRTPIEKLDGVQSVDAFLISHIHPDHLSLEHIQKLSPKKIYLNQECIDALSESSVPGEIIQIKDGDAVDIGGIKVSCFYVDHGPNVKSVLKENLGFLLEIDGQKVYFAGDMFYESGIDVSQLELDLALIPVGAFYTFGPEEAFIFAKKFKSIGKVVAMHERGEIEHIEKFLELSKGILNAE
ncbi:MAG: MBL fold metallo-hydrolase [Candidatus Pacebacteria bacterium]|jgi:L-ascorbate metabolism protein UlaG (beta-lactamase superfamily)|nr:MBL fold metallo-hydrolase [Candidatus Paceibacterota bacterium]